MQFPIRIGVFWSKPARRWIGLALVSLPLAFILRQAGFNAGFLVGPMVAAIGFGVGDSRLTVSRPVFVGAQAIIGLLVARSLTGPILASVEQDWAPMLLAVATTVAAGAVVGWVLARSRVLPGSTAAWGSVPGAASVMVALSAEYGADFRMVGFMTYLRLILVVLTASLVAQFLGGDEYGLAAPRIVPPLFAAVSPVDLIETLAIALFGALIGWRLRVPAGALLLPMILGAALQGSGLIEITLPPWLLAITYTALGWYIGLGFNRDLLVYALRAIPKLLLASAMLIGLCALSAWLLTWLLGISALTAYLATSPGGLDSVAIIVVGSHADIPFVLAVQTLRLFTVILAGPPIAKLIARTAR